MSIQHLTVARTAATLLVAAVVGLALADHSGPAVHADPAVTGYPNSIAVLGDSISAGTNTDMIGDNPANSWSTGTNPAVNSIYQRILAQNAGISGNHYNDAVSGSQVIDIIDQAADAVAQDAELVTILIGANDVCTGTEASMTPVATFQTRFETAMGILSSGLPDARIAVGSIPNIYHLWDLFKFDSTANFIWGTYGICQSMLVNPQSMAAADVTRRANVSQRNVDFNAVIDNVCATYVHCRYDEGAGYAAVFQTQHVSFDYFHPSVEGQALAASVAWDNSYDMSDATAPSSSASTSPSGGGLEVTISATDNDAVSDVEYKLNGGAYVRYTAPVLLSAGVRIEWRAVDVNGNIEATQCVATPDADTDCTADTSDNCLGLSNPTQANWDADTLGDACDADDDNDGVTDVAEGPCGGTTPSLLRPERKDGAFAGVDDDGDTLIDESLPGGTGALDCDGDGYTGTADSHVFAGAPGDQDSCGVNGWPADMIGGAFSGNKVNTQDLATFLGPVRHLNSDVGANPGNVRWDVLPGSGPLGFDINVQDMANVVTVAPPMLGGPRAFNGPPCPWAP